MHTEKIFEFSNFLTRPPESYSEIAKFLVMKTFSNESFSEAYIGKLSETGDVCVLGGFGWTAAEYKSLVCIPIQAKYPITDAIKTNEVTVYNNNAEFKVEYPLPIGCEIKTSVDWLSAVVIPFYPTGGMVFSCAKDIQIDESMNQYMVAIGALLGLYSSGIPKPRIAAILNGDHLIDLPENQLSDRQFVISGLLERGFSNAQIAEEIGYSESLVRQETVAIYRKLQVTGRKAMQAIKSLDPTEVTN